MITISYDVAVDAAYLELGPEPEAAAIARTVQAADGILLDFDSAGVLRGIELLGASALLEPSLLAQATKTAR